MMATVSTLPRLTIISRGASHDGSPSSRSRSQRGWSRHSPGVNLFCSLQTGKLDFRASAWERPVQGLCKGFGVTKLGNHQGTGSRKKFVVEATSAEVSNNHVSILGQDVPKLRVGLTAASTILLCVSNRVLYKMSLVPLKNYPFFLAQVLTFGYVVVYSTFLLLRYRSGVVTREMLELPKMPFIIMGALEAVALAAGMAAAANLTGAHIPMLNQTYLVWQLLFSATILKKRYTWGQIFGCVLVIAGVSTVVSSGSVGAATSVGGVKSPQLSGLLWPMVMIGAKAFSSRASIIKEYVFRDAKTRLKGGSVDLFVVNTFGSTAQALFVLLLLPLMSSLRGIPFQQLPTYFREGAACFYKTGLLENGCEGIPWVPAFYVATNLAFNICSLSLLKQSSAVVTSLCVMLAVPLSITAFTFPLPLLGKPANLPPGLFAGAAILVTGLAFYNFSAEKQQKELKERFK